jgi:hypothetical protein
VADALGGSVAVGAEAVDAHVAGAADRGQLALEAADQAFEVLALEATLEAGAGCLGRLRAESSTSSRT